MPARSLSSGEWIEIEPARGAALADGDLAVVILASFDLHSLYGHDGRKAGRTDRRRDRWKDVSGLLRFDVNGQETQLDWSASVRGRSQKDLRFTLKAPEKLAGRLLYFGRPQGLLALEVGLVESDAAARRRLANASRVIELLEGAAARVPGPTAALGGGLGLVRAVLDFARQNELDDLELRALTSLGDPVSRAKDSVLRTGRYTLRRRRAETGATDFELGLDVLAVEPAARSSRLLVLLESLELAFESRLDRHVFVFEAAVGSGRGQTALGFAEPLSAGRRGRLENVLSVRQRPLFAGSAADGIPFRFQFATLRDKKRAREIASLLGAGAGFAGSLLDEEGRAAAAQAAKAADGLASLLIDLVPGKSAQGRVDGVIGVGDPRRGRDPGHQVVLIDAASAGWRREEIVVGAGRDRVRVRLRIGPLP